MSIQRVKELIDNKQFVFGTHVSLGDSCISELIGDVGFNAVWIDWEHSALDRMQILSHLMALRGTGCAAFVRVPWNDPIYTKPILEMGPDAVVFPMICTRSEAEAAVASCTYPPKGSRGFGPRRANRYGAQSNSEYLATYEEKLWRVMQIEHVVAVKNLDEILKVDGVDAVVVGPNDLSGSIGLLGQTRHPDVLALMDEIGTICCRARKPFGSSMGLDTTSIKEWRDRGASFIFAGNDTGYLHDGAKTTLDTLKDIFY